MIEVSHGETRLHDLVHLSHGPPLTQVGAKVSARWMKVRLTRLNTRPASTSIRPVVGGVACVPPFDQAHLDQHRSNEWTRLCLSRCSGYGAAGQGRGVAEVGGEFFGLVVEGLGRGLGRPVVCASSS
jgi:hypothetical protein